MNTLPFFLAQRILMARSSEKGFFRMTKICFISIFIGSFALAIVTAIMHGFEVAIIEKMQSIHSDITIDGNGKEIDYELLQRVITTEFPDIIACSPTTTRHALINTDTTEKSTPAVIMLNAIDPQADNLTRSLLQKITISLPHQSLSNLIVDNTIIIGKDIAATHKLSVGDTIELLFIRSEEKIDKKKVTFDSVTAIIGGIFNTGIDEFDSNAIYCSFELLDTMFPGIGIEQISIAMKDGINEKQLIDMLHERTKLLTYSWKELYPSLIAAQKLEKYVSFFVIALILLVANMNIIALLYMHITQKRYTIALLKALGMTNCNISSIFFIIGTFLSISASLSGLITALFASYCIKQFPFIPLPDSYYVTHLPIAMSYNIIGAVFFIVIVFSFLATLFSAQQIRSINISDTLRLEG